MDRSYIFTSMIKFGTGEFVILQEILKQLSLFIFQSLCSAPFMHAYNHDDEREDMKKTPSRRMSDTPACVARAMKGAVVSIESSLNNTSRKFFTHLQ